MQSRRLQGLTVHATVDQTKRPSYIGITLASQAKEAGSTPAGRSIPSGMPVPHCLYCQVLRRQAGELPSQFNRTVDLLCPSRPNPSCCDSILAETQANTRIQMGQHELRQNNLQSPALRVGADFVSSAKVPE